MQGRSESIDVPAFSNTLDSASFQSKRLICNDLTRAIGPHAAGTAQRRRGSSERRPLRPHTATVPSRPRPRSGPDTRMHVLPSKKPAPGESAAALRCGPPAGMARRLSRILPQLLLLGLECPHLRFATAWGRSASIGVPAVPDGRSRSRPPHVSANQGRCNADSGYGIMPGDDQSYAASAPYGCRVQAR
jgi:hypothetical protein